MRSMLPARLLLLLCLPCWLLPGVSLGATGSSPNPEKSNETFQPKLQIGVGWPDVRVRAHLIANFDGEAKVAFEDGIQAYGGRIYLQPARLGFFDMTVGIEGGWLRFDGVENL